MSLHCSTLATIARVPPPRWRTRPYHSLPAASRELLKAPLCVVVTHFTFCICPARLENFVLGRSVGQAHRRRCPVAP